MNTTIPGEPDVGAWYALYAGRLRSVVRRIVDNEADADDATQDAFLAAFRFRARYHAAHDPYPWLRRIATRKAQTIVAAARPALELIEGALPAVPSAESEAVAREDRRTLRGLVASDPALTLHLVHGLRFREVGERLGIPLPTAATRIRRGKIRIRSLIQETNPHFRESQPA